MLFRETHRRAWTGSVRSLPARCSAAWQWLRAAVRRIDPSSSAHRVNGLTEFLASVFVPLLTFGAVCALTDAYGVAYRSHCNSASNFFRNLLFQPTPPSTCTSVPFLSDIPTMILAITCPMAFVAYRLLRRRLEHLISALQRSGLVLTGNSTSLDDRIKGLRKAVDMRPSARIAVAGVSCALVIWLYSRNIANGHLFDTLASTGPDGGSNAQALRDSWWANYHHHPLLAGVCVLIGSVGVTYALRAAWLYTALGFALFETWRSKAHLSELPVEYVPRWRDKSHGWGPVTGSLMLIYMSTINFAISMVAVFDMLRNERQTLDVAIVAAGVGIFSNLVIILTSFVMVIAVHAEVARRLRKRLTERPYSMTAGQYAFAASDLVAWRRVPVASVSASVIKILPGLYALFEFIRAFSGVRVR